MTDSAEMPPVRYWVHSLRHGGDPRMILLAIKGWVRRNA